MKFALVDGIKRAPKPKLKGICCNCGSPTQAKCGTRKVWHWAHVNLQHCDSWWENETEWHRLWKSYFPEQNQEVVHFDEITGEKHIADIRTDNGMIIEIQNSPMSEAEMLSRENFYEKMMWIINGERFKRKFIILGKLPDPQSQVAQLVSFHKPIYRPGYLKEIAEDSQYSGEREKLDRCVNFHLRCENLSYEARRDLGDTEPMMVKLPDFQDREKIFREISDDYVGHHLFFWKNPRTVWFQSTKPVFIDFGDEDLWRLMDYDIRGLKCVRKISKAALIEKNGGHYAATQIT